MSRKHLELECVQAVSVLLAVLFLQLYLFSDMLNLLLTVPVITVRYWTYSEFR